MFHFTAVVAHTISRFKTTIAIHSRHALSKNYCLGTQAMAILLATFLFCVTFHLRLESYESNFL